MVNRLANLPLRVIIDHSDQYAWLNGRALLREDIYLSHIYIYI